MITDAERARAIDIAIQLEHKAGRVRPSSKAPDLEARGWKTWLMTLFPFWFAEEFSNEHEQYWELYWSVLLAIKRGEVVSNSLLVVLLLLGRGLGKSSVLEAARIMRGAILGYGYSLIVSETEDQAQEHLGNCRILIEHPDSKLVEYYPLMAITDASDATKGLNTADRREMFICKNGYILRAKGLSAKMRGLRIGIYRPDDIAFDDVDDINDSLTLSASKLRVITASILPVQARENVTINVGQNLISSHSVVNQIYTGKSDALADRTVIGVANAFTVLDIESQIDDTGRMRHKILDSSVPSWAGFSVKRAQKFLDNSGLETFYAEYQNEFDQYRSGKVIPEYNEASQLITWSEFAKVYGERRIPQHWQCKAGLDVGYSEGRYPHYSGWTFIATAGLNSPVPNAVFLYRSKSFKGISIDDQAIEVKGEMYPNEKVVTWQMSHERTGEMLTLRQKYNLPFNKFQYYKKEDGVAQWRHLSKCDHTKPNPFKVDFELDGEYKLGRPQLFYIVDDDQTVFARDDRGHKLFREQVSTWEYVPVKLTENGQTIQQPSKVNDDMLDAFRGILALFGPQAEGLTLDETVEAAMPEQYTIAEMRKRSPFAKGLSDGQEIARALMEQEVRDRLNMPKETPSWLEGEQDDDDLSDGW